VTEAEVQSILVVFPFKHTTIKIAYKTTNTLGNILKETRNTNKHEQAGVAVQILGLCIRIFVKLEASRRYSWKS
jgi:hypothetical protein